MQITDRLYEEKQALFYMCLLQLLISICTLGAAWQLSRVISDVFLNGISLNAAAADMGMLLFLLLIKALLQYPLKRQLCVFSSELQFQIRQKLHRSLAVQTVPDNKLQLLAVETTEALDKLSTAILPQILSLAVLMPLFLLTIAFMDWQSALIMLVTLPIAPILLALIGHKTKAAALEQWEKLGTLTAAFKDMLAGIITLKLFRQEVAQGERLSENSRDFSAASMKVLQLAFVSSFTLELITTLTIAILAVSIGLRLLYGEMSFSIAFFMLLLLPEFYRPLRQGGIAFHAAAEVHTAWKTLQNTIETGRSDLRRGARDELRVPPDISVHELSFTYPEAPLPTLQDISARFPANKVTCICGTSGAGKTTLLKVLAGLLSPQQGSVLFSGKKLADMAKESRQKLISYIPQAPHIFQGTLGENISLFDCGKKEDIAEKINGALKSAGLSLSPDTSIGEGGQGLSNGQLHRLGLARAFYQDKPVVLLDEPTVGLEPAEEKELLNTLDDFSRHRTVIVISHREAVRKWADTEIAIEAGTAVPAEEVRHE